jgi:hypothetical protein
VADLKRGISLSKVGPDGYRVGTSNNVSLVLTTHGLVFKVKAGPGLPDIEVLMSSIMDLEDLAKDWLDYHEYK